MVSSKAQGKAEASHAQCSRVADLDDVLVAITEALAIPELHDGPGLQLRQNQWPAVIEVLEELLGAIVQALAVLVGLGMQREGQTHQT